VSKQLVSSWPENAAVEAKRAIRVLANPSDPD
jgi:hypothetical protein